MIDRCFQLKELEGKINTLREKVGKEERIVVNARSLDGESQNLMIYLVNYKLSLCEIITHE